jgi:hypothetical protein
MRAPVVLALVALAAAAGALGACSEAPGDYCDTPGVCTLPDGAVPDVKKDASDAAPEAAPADAATTD